MLKLPDRPFNKRQLLDELESLDLPSFTGFTRLSRETDANGRAVLKNGAIKKVSPYILIKSGDLSTVEIAAVTQAVASHIPVVNPPPDPRFEDQAKAIEAATTLGDLKAALAPLTRLL